MFQRHGQFTKTTRSWNTPFHHHKHQFSFVLLLLYISATGKISNCSETNHCLSNRHRIESRVHKLWKRGTLSGDCDCLSTFQFMKVFDLNTSSDGQSENLERTSPQWTNTTYSYDNILYIILLWQNRENTEFFSFELGFIHIIPQESSSEYV